MNYLFVGTAECTKKMESKKRKERKERKNLRRRRRRRRNTYRRILQRLLDAFVLLQLDGGSSSQRRRRRKREKERKKEREKEGVRRERQRKRLGKFFSLPRFVEREPASTFAYYAEL